MFQSDIAEKNRGEPIIIRRALAFAEMLRAMTDPRCSSVTKSFVIRPGELIVGVAPMGSVGLGKEFPRYLLDEERRLAMMTSRDEESMFGHNCPDHSRVLEFGLLDIANRSRTAIASLSGSSDPWAAKKTSFHRAVIICCDAVVRYAMQFAELADSLAAVEADPARRAELVKIADVCRHVPAKPARDFRDAVQSVWFVHLALHATLDLVSPGRLDQVLEPYRASSQPSVAEAVELLECFLIQGAERLNGTTAYLLKQDHQDFGTGLGTSPVFLDQVASANNFMQNVVVGGRDRSGKDATNRCTYLFLEACRNVGLPTPVVMLRVHGETPQPLLEAAAEALHAAGNSLPILYNDDVIIPGLMAAGVPAEEAHDYAVDGCWEPILNARGDWTFGMVNLLSVMECALNSGCALTSDPSFLRGQKRSFATLAPEALTSFEALQEAFVTQLQLHVDKVGLSIYDFYNIDGSVTPTPFLSALLGSCHERGLDKTWGGARYILGGLIAVAAPNCANALAAIRRLVYQDKRWTLRELVEALRSDCMDALELRAALRGAPKFGNADPEADEMLAWLAREFDDAARRCKVLADKVFRDAPAAPELDRVREWRSLSGYEGPPMRERFGADFDILFTTGMGTFGQYVSMGKGVAASADGRARNAPVVPNCSPASGTALRGLGSILKSMGALPLDRFGAGVVLDVCVAPTDPATLARIIQHHVRERGSILTVSVADLRLLKDAHEACLAVERGTAPAATLEAYAGLSVRVGGWNAPFISMSPPQREDYLARHLASDAARIH